METLLIIGIALLVVLNLLFVIVLTIAFKFFKDLKFLVNALHEEADKVRLDMASLRLKLAFRSSWLALGLGLLARRHSLKHFADLFFKSNNK